jgi:pimeloyl-ACP methyl ester carboxylesterase
MGLLSDFGNGMPVAAIGLKWDNFTSRHCYRGHSGPGAVTFEELVLFLFKKPGRLVAAAFALVLLYLLVLFLAVRLILYPPWYHPAVAHEGRRNLAACTKYQQKTYIYCGDPASDFNLNFQEFASERSVFGRIIGVSGWYVPANQGATGGQASTSPGPAVQGVFILAHGLAADRRAMMKHVPYLNRAGFDVLVVDAHNHGLSYNDGRGISLGRFEAESLLQAMEWWARLPSTMSSATSSATGPVYIMGTSQGAFSAIYAAFLLTQEQSQKNGMTIAGIVAENSYSSVRDLLRDAPVVKVFPSAMRTHIWPLLSLWSGFDYSDLDIERFGSLVKVPILAIHGGQDHFIPLAHSERIMASIGSKFKDLWVVPYGDHEKIWNNNPSLYENRVLEFVRATQRDVAKSDEGPSVKSRVDAVPLESLIQNQEASLPSKPELESEPAPESDPEVGE